MKKSCRKKAYSLIKIPRCAGLKVKKSYKKKAYTLRSITYLFAFGIEGLSNFDGSNTVIHSPGHWTRDLLRLPPIAAELPDEFEQSFLIGKPWFFGEHEFLTERCILS